MKATIHALWKLIGPMSLVAMGALSPLLPCAAQGTAAPPTELEASLLSNMEKPN